MNVSLELSAVCFAAAGTQTAKRRLDQLTIFGRSSSAVATGRRLANWRAVACEQQLGGRVMP